MEQRLERDGEAVGKRWKRVWKEMENSLERDGKEVGQRW